MKGIRRLFILIIVAIVGGVIVSSIAYNLIVIQKIQDDAARATIVAGVIAFLGTIVTTIYKEISSYYKDKIERTNKKWNLVLPLIEKHYMSWINSALSLTDALNNIATDSPNDTQLNRVMYLFSVFYGTRLRFIMSNGGYIFLSSVNEEKKVNEAYKKVKDSLQWAGDETPKRVSELQKLFISKAKPEQPYVLNDFETDLTNSESLKEGREMLKGWLKVSTAKDASKALQEFADTFKDSIDNLSSSWD